MLLFILFIGNPPLTDQIHGNTQNDTKELTRRGRALDIQCRVKATVTRDEGFTVVPKSNEEASSLNYFEERSKLYVMGTKKESRHLCGPRVLAQMDPEKQPFKMIQAAITNIQLTRKGRAHLIVRPLRASLGTKPIQERGDCSDT